MVINEKYSIKKKEVIEAVGLEKEFQEALRRGYYLGILEDYLREGRWGMEKIGEDIWQNFFDANNHTLDGIDFTIEGQAGESIIEIKGKNNYPYTRLLHLGGGEKDDPNRSVGRFHEGTKLTSLQLLRDHGFTSVIYGAADWEMEFYLATPPSGSVEEKKRDLRGLYVQLRNKEFSEGNYVRLRGQERQSVEEIAGARELFFHSGNEDFKNPTVENEKGGVAFHYERNGNFYLNGGRVHYASKDHWDTLPDFTVWTKEEPSFKGKRIEIGRDRSLVTENELEDIILPFLIESWSEEDQRRMIDALDPVWTKTEDWYHPHLLAKVVLAKTISRLRERNYHREFPPHYLADDLSYGQDLVKGLGYTLCERNLADIGMTRASVFQKELIQLLEQEPTSEEKERLHVLMDAADEIFKQSKNRMDRVVLNLGASIMGSDQYRLRRELESKPIRIFSGKHPFLMGRYDQEFVWMNRAAVGEEFSDAMSIYFHELCHKYGDDNSASFSYALTAMIGNLIEFQIRHPERMYQFEQQWQGIAIPKRKESFKDIEYLFVPAFGENFSPLDPHTSKALTELIDKRFEGVYSFQTILLVFDAIMRDPRVKELNQALRTATMFAERSDDKVREMMKDELFQRRNRLENLIGKEENRIKSLKRAKHREQEMERFRAKGYYEHLKNISKQYEELVDVYASRKARNELHRILLTNSHVPLIEGGDIKVDLSLLNSKWSFSRAMLNAFFERYESGYMKEKEFFDVMRQFFEWVGKEEVGETKEVAERRLEKMLRAALFDLKPFAEKELTSTRIEYAKFLNDALILLASNS
jgi:hypothetical protein